MKNYLALLKHIRDNGEDYGNRTKFMRRSICFGPRSLHFDLRESFPLPSTSKTNTRAIFEELRWIISGSTNIKALDARIWDKWANEDGELGSMYGKQLRDWDGEVDQLADAVKAIKDYPNASDIVMTTWNPKTVPLRYLKPAQNIEEGRQCLANCHGTVIQFFVRGGHLDMTTYQRSADFPLGVRFNLASYALLLFLVAQETGLRARHLDYTFGDAHIYHNQFQGVDEMLSRKPDGSPISLSIPIGMGLWDFDPKQVKVHGYGDAQPAIDFGEVAV